MKIRHWSATNHSGMHHVAMAMAEAERRMGHDSHVVDIALSELWSEAMDADVHVNHTDFPETFRAQCVHPYKLVFVVHGTPEVVFEESIARSNVPGYAPADGWQLTKTHLMRADATVTFWERHASFYRALFPERGKAFVHTVPLGVDTAYWAAGTAHGKYVGAPSVWMSENQYRLKWALDTIIAWPLVNELVPQAWLHAHYIPPNLHRWFFDLANSNGCAFKAVLSAATYPHESLRDIWKDVDYFWSPVRYGDHNNIFMQAAATGIETISYRGNVYADYWVTEGDQRTMAKELAAIFRDETPPRADKRPVPSLDDMGRAMVQVYESIP